MRNHETLWGAFIDGIGFWGWGIGYVGYLAYRVHGGL